MVSHPFFDPAQTTHTTTEDQLANAARNFASAQSARQEEGFARPQTKRQCGDNQAKGQTQPDGDRGEKRQRQQHDDQIKTPALGAHQQVIHGDPAGRGCCRQHLDQAFG